MSARFEHEAGANPIKLREKMLAPLAHVIALEQRPTTGNHAHGIAAGVRVEAEESVSGHKVFLKVKRAD